MKKGSLYLIPVIISDGTQKDVLPRRIESTCKTIKHYAVENIRTARRFISSLKLGIDIENLDFQLLDKNTPLERLALWEKILESGQDVGLMSESGCPGIADPGSILVKHAHKKGVSVIPLVGPSSIFLALMASGFNGQSFVFHGYVPIEKKDRKVFIKRVERNAQGQQTQIFMDTPYRNNHLLKDILSYCSESTLLCVAKDLTGKDEIVKTKTVKEWKANIPELHKVPSMFLLYAN